MNWNRRRIVFDDRRRLDRANGRRGFLGACFILAFLSLTGMSASAEERFYRSVVKKDTIFHEVRSEPAQEGQLLTIIITRGPHTETDSLWLDSSYHTVRWRYIDSDGERDLTAVREGLTIRLKGTQRGGYERKVFQVDALPWKQFFPFDLEPFARSDEESIRFWAIGTRGPVNMKCARFTARRRGEGVVRIGDVDVQALQIRVAMSGWRSRLWHADYWFRKDDGTYIAMEGKDGPGERIGIEDFK